MRELKPHEPEIIECLEHEFLTMPDCYVCMACGVVRYPKKAGDE